MFAPEKQTSSNYQAKLTFLLFGFVIVDGFLGHEICFEIPQNGPKMASTQPQEGLRRGHDGLMDRLRWVQEAFFRALTEQRCLNPCAFCIGFYNIYLSIFGYQTLLF